MGNFLKIIAFSFVLLASFSGFANYAIPPIIPESPPKEAVISGEMSMDDFITLGGKIFSGKGTCTLCHNALLRAPLLDGIGARAADIIKGDGYKGKATDSGEYLRESLVDTSAYVVPGFGKPGTNDSVSPMPDVSKGSIGLNEAELNAVIAYLQSSSGVEVTVSIPSGDAAATEEEAPAPSSAATAEEAITKHGCGMCHVVLSEEGDMGPPLKDMGTVAATRVEGMSASDYIRQAIMDPNAFIPEGFDPDMMPADLGEAMTAKELEMIVAFLADSKGGAVPVAEIAPVEEAGEAPAAEEAGKAEGADSSGG